MLVFPNCKINLGLNITAKRPDGFHDIETVFFPLALQDALEIIRSEQSDPIHDISFQSSGLSIEGEQENNLCIKAYRLLKKDFPSLPPIQMHLHKAIPMGAGLGGGSSDGAYTLALLNQCFQLGLSTEQLLNYALGLGSDCPFFIINRPCFAQGRGELMEPISIDLSGYRFLLVNPGIHISTAWAFSQIKPTHPSTGIRQIIQQPVNQWKNDLRNDFELPVIDQYPDIGQIKDQLYQQGAVYASLTGSGSTVFGLFPKDAQISLSPYQNHRVQLV